MTIQPYVFFDGRCDEAIEFYRGALGAEVQMLMRFKDSPEPQSHGNPDKVMHAQIRIGGTVLLLSDGRCIGGPEFKGFALSLTVASEAEAEQKFNALSAGGKINMPMTKTFFSPRFGMLADKFGVMWMVYVGSN